MADTAMKPLPPIRAMACERADASGSSGRGNGMRSMMTSWHDEPGTSTPCHRVSVPKRQVRGSRANWRTSVADLVLALAQDRDVVAEARRASTSAAVCAARIDEKSPSVRPPAARTSASISSRVSSPAPSRPGGGRCAAT